MPVTINGSGQVPVQAVSTTKVNTFSSTSGTMIDITGLSVNITPTSASNKILIIASLIVSSDSWNTGGMAVNLVRNSTALALGISGTSINATSGYNAWSSSIGNTYGNFSPMVITFIDSPSTTSSTTYKLQGRSFIDGYTWTINRAMATEDRGFSSTITVMEISG